MKLHKKPSVKLHKRPLVSSSSLITGIAALLFSATVLFSSCRAEPSDPSSDSSSLPEDGISDGPSDSSADPAEGNSALPENENRASSQENSAPPENGNGEPLEEKSSLRFALSDGYSFSLLENSEAATTIGQLSVAERSGGDSGEMHYEIVATSIEPSGEQPAQGPFSIDPQLGELKTAEQAQIDFETASAYSLQVQATDTGNGEYAQTGVEIAILNVDEEPQFAQHPQTYTVWQDNPQGIFPIQLAATDPDDPETAISYSIEGGDGAGLFEIDAQSGQIAVREGALLDYQRASGYYELIVQASEGAAGGEGAQTTRTTIRINLVAVNAPPQFLFPGSATEYHFGEIYRSETPMGTLVGRVEAGAENGGQPLEVRYSLTPSHPKFSIDPESGEIRTTTSGDQITLGTKTLTALAFLAAEPQKSSSTTVAIEVLGDEDSHPAGSDNCPVVTNEGQWDADMDGIGDACDDTIMNPPMSIGELKHKDWKSACSQRSVSCLWARSAMAG